MFKLNTLKLLLNKKIISKNRFFQTEIKIYTRKLKQKEIPIQYNCKTQTVGIPFYLNAIFESIYLLFKLKFFKKNYIE